MIEVIPAIIPENFGDIEDAVMRVTGLVSCVQIDISDGKFSPSATWPYKYAHDADFEALLSEEDGLPEWEQIDYEIDLMAREPEKKLDELVRLGVSSVILHIESTDKLAEAVEKARYFDMKIGLALNPSTPNDMLDEWVEKIDFVQFMGNDRIGYHGVSLDRNVLQKISAFRKKHPRSIIGIDIGVDEETAPDLVSAGVTRLVSGSAIFDSTDVAGTIDFFRNL